MHCLGVATSIPRNKFNVDQPADDGQLRQIRLYLRVMSRNASTAKPEMPNERSNPKSHQSLRL